MPCSFDVLAQAAMLPGLNVVTPSNGFLDVIQEARKRRRGGERGRRRRGRRI